MKYPANVRQCAIDRVQAGQSTREVGKSLGVPSSTVYRWAVNAGVNTSAYPYIEGERLDNKLCLALTPFMRKAIRNAAEQAGITQQQFIRNALRAALPS